VGPEPVWTLWRRETSCPCRESNPGHPAHSPSRRHGHRSDKNGVYSTFILHLNFVFNCFIHACLLLTTSSFCNSGCISASRPDRFTPRERALLYSLDRRLGGPPNQSGQCAEEKHLTPARNPTPAVQPVARQDATDTGVIRMECTPLHIYFSPEFCL
jgi:hypothetical protein